MANSDSGSDSFLSADEFGSDDNDASKGKDVNIKKQKHISSDEKLDYSPSQSLSVNLKDSKLSDDDKDISTAEPNSSVTEEQGKSEVRTYRKRPERLKNVEKVQNPKKVDLVPSSVDLGKIARKDVLTDLTSQFTSTITKGLASFQEKSLSIKGFVQDNLVSDVNKVEEVRFVYDDDRTIESVSNLPDEPPKSNINDDILKLSNAFAKLNEQKQLSDKLPSESPVKIHEVNQTETDHYAKTSVVTEESAKSSTTDELFKLNESTSKFDNGDGWNELDDAALATDISPSKNEAGTKLKGEVNPTAGISTGWDDLMITHDELNRDSVETRQQDKISKSEIKSGNIRKDKPPLDVSKFDNQTQMNREPENLKEPIEVIDKENAEVVEKTQDVDGWDDWKISDDDEVPKKEMITDNQEIAVPGELPQKDIGAKNMSQENAASKKIPLVGDKHKTVNQGEKTKKIDPEEINGEVDKKPIWSLYAEIAEETQDEDCWDDWKISDEEEEEKEQEVAKVDDSDGDGWDEWGDDDDEFSETGKEDQLWKARVAEERPMGSHALRSGSVSQPKEWTGWDSFGQKKEHDWGLAGWGINSLLNTATAVTSNLSAVIESGLGVPDPETMARIKVQEERAIRDTPNDDEHVVEEVGTSQFPFQHIVAGVGKIVEVAKVQEIGSRVLTGGLDTLETIGKKTMEVLQEGDPGLKKKRAILSEQGQMLSKVLKDARDRAMEEDRQSKEIQSERRVHFETLFDDFHGLIHLEALEMLSRQCELRLEQIQQSLPADKSSELQETLDEVKQLCEVDEEFDNVEVDNFEEAITEVVAPLRNELSVSKIIEVHSRLGDWLASADTNQTNAHEMYEQAISTIAELTAAVTMQFHKSGELLILKERRKTVEEADCLLQLSSHLCYELKAITENLAKQLSKKDAGDVASLVANLHVESENAVAYIKQAFELLIPVIQLGAA